MSVAAVDCGTNTVRLLVLGDDGLPVLRTSRIVRLGEGVDAAGRLAPAALDRAFTALDAYAAILGPHHVTQVRVCATSAVRDSPDRAAFAAGVVSRLGVEPEVLTGHEEAMLTFLGAVRGLRVPTRDPVLVVDVGGGSTELVLGARDGSVHAAVSADVGAVRLTERHLRTDPPDADELAACAADVDRALEAALDDGVDLATPRTVVAVAGTALTLAVGLTGVRDLEAADQSTLDPGALHALTTRLLTMTTAERVATGWIDRGRADVIGAGALVLDRVLARTPAETVVASVPDVLDGIARGLLD